MRSCAAFLCLVGAEVAVMGSWGSEAGTTILRPVENPKAARTATLAYEIGEADVYYGEMVVQKTTDGSFFMACGWDNGYFGLQQYVGEKQRSVVFAAWNGANEDNPAAAKAAGAVEILDWNRGGKTNVYGPDKLGAQYMRQVDWQVGETNRFVIDAVRAGTQTTYSAWLHIAGSGGWEKVATFRGYSRTWMRGYLSFIEDFRRDTKSATETRRAHFGNYWIHQFEGTWIPVTEATYVTSASRFEARDKVDAGDEEGGFFLATGGSTVNHRKMGTQIKLPAIPFRVPEPPKLPFLNLDKAKP